jgi:hypothetical protein
VFGGLRRPPQCSRCAFADAGALLLLARQGGG